MPCLAAGCWKRGRISSIDNHRPAAWKPRIPDMIPIHQLLSRIHWDEAYARSRFVIGYWDRLERKVLHVDLREITWDRDNPALFSLVDEDGAAHSIPYHRVREVWRDGRLIWERHPHEGMPAQGHSDGQ